MAATGLFACIFYHHPRVCKDRHWIPVRAVLPVLRLVGYHCNFGRGWNRQG